MRAKLYAHDDIGLDLDNTVYAAWVPMRSTAIKKQSYIVSDELPGAVAQRHPTPTSLQFAVNIWQRFQMPAHGRKGRRITK